MGTLYHGALFSGTGAYVPVGGRPGSGPALLAHGEFFARALGVKPDECFFA